MTILLGIAVAGVFGAARASGQTSGSEGASASQRAGGAEVSGVVRMPEICSPSVSPAVVYLRPAGSPATYRKPGTPALPATHSEIALVNQRGLQFTPRVQAIALGQTVRFTNEDGETHNVHVVSRGFEFNQSMAPGRAADFTPERPGVMILACDVHLHMRGYVVVSPSPWVQVCSPQGRFRLEDVPDGRYVLNVWHEMGQPLRQEIVVQGGKALELPKLVLAGPSAPPRAPGAGNAAPARPWADVIDRIGVALAASREAASRKGELARARPWPRMHTGSSSRAPTWRSPSGGTWAMPGPASSSNTSGASVPTFAR
jgi:high-affinity iron transporter